MIRIQNKKTLFKKPAAPRWRVTVGRDPAQGPSSTDSAPASLLVETCFRRVSRAGAAAGAAAHENPNPLDLMVELGAARESHQRP